MREYISIIKGMEYLLNERLSQREIHPEPVTQDDETEQDNQRSVSPLHAALTALINLLTK